MQFSCTTELRTLKYTSVFQNILCKIYTKSLGDVFIMFSVLTSLGCKKREESLPHHEGSRNPKHTRFVRLCVIVVQLPLIITIMRLLTQDMHCNRPLQYLEICLTIWHSVYTRPSWSKNVITIHFIFDLVAYSFSGQEEPHKTHLLICCLNRRL